MTNNVFEDGIAYDSATIEYIEALGRVNERLAAEADEVVEVVAGDLTADQTRLTRSKSTELAGQPGIERKQTCELSNHFS